MTFLEHIKLFAVKRISDEQEGC